MASVGTPRGLTFWLKSRRSRSATSRDLEAAAPCAPWWRPPGCSAQPSTMTEPSCDDGGSGDERAATAHEPHRAPDVLRCGTPAVAQDRAQPERASVGVGPAKAETERARESCLCPAGVGARRERSVAPSRRDRGDRLPGDRGGRDGRGTGRRKVGQVVEPGRSPAELRVRTNPVANHRVERVYGPVSQRSRRPEQEAVKHRADDAVARVLGHGLDHGARDLGLREALRVTADQRTNAGLRPFEVALEELVLYGSGGPAEAAHRKGG